LIDYDGYPLDSFLDPILPKKPMAVLIPTVDESEVPGKSQYQYVKYYNNVTLFQISYPDYLTIMNYMNKYETSLNITLSSSPNYWISIYGSVWYTVWIFILEAISISNLAFNIYVFLIHISVNGWRPMLSLYILILEILGNIWRTIFLVDPSAAKGIYSAVFCTWAATIYFPWTFASCLMIILYWYEILTSQSIKVNLFFKEMAIPFYVIAILLIVMEFSFSIPRALGVLNILLKVNGGIYLVFAVALIALSLYVSVMLVNKVNEMSNMRTSGKGSGMSKRKVIDAILLRITLQIIGFVLFIVACIMIIAGFLFNPVKTIIMITFVFIGLSLASFSQTYAVLTGTKKKSSGETKTAKTQTSTVGGSTKKSTSNEEIDTLPDTREDDTTPGEENDS